MERSDESEKFRFLNMEIAESSAIPDLQSSFGGFKVRRQNESRAAPSMLVPCRMKNIIYRGFSKPHGLKSKWPRMRRLWGKQVEKERFMIRVEGREVFYGSIRKQETPGDVCNASVKAFLYVMDRRALIIPCKGGTGIAQIDEAKIIHKRW